MAPLDRFILLISLSIFFFGGALSLANIKIRKDSDAPKSVMVSPTAAEMSSRDPRQIAAQIIKLCYSEEKYNSQIRTSGNQMLIGKAVTNGEVPIEIYANNILGYGGTFSIYVREARTDGTNVFCRIVHGKNLEILIAANAAALGNIGKSAVPSSSDEDTDSDAQKINGSAEEPSEAFLRRQSPELQNIPAPVPLGNNPG